MSLFSLFEHSTIQLTRRHSFEAGACVAKSVSSHAAKPGTTRDRILFRCSRTRDGRKRLGITDCGDGASAVHTIIVTLMAMVIRTGFLSVVLTLAAPIEGVALKFDWNVQNSDNPREDDHKGDWPEPNVSGVKKDDHQPITCTMCSLQCTAAYGGPDKI